MVVEPVDLKKKKTYFVKLLQNRMQYVMKRKTDEIIYMKNLVINPELPIKRNSSVAMIESKLMTKYML